MHGVHLANLYPALGVAGALVVIAGTVSAIGRTVAPLERVAPAMRIDWERLKTFGGRVGAAAAELERDPAEFGLVLGHSSAEQNVDPAALVEPTGMRWLLVAGSGGSAGAPNLVFHLTLAAEAGLRPAAVAIVANPFVFIRPPPADSILRTEAPPWRDVRRRLKYERAQFWLTLTRNAIADRAQGASFAARRALANATEWPASAVYPSERDVWSAYFENAEGQMEPARFADRIELARAARRFDGAEYGEETRGRVRELLDAARTISPCVVVVLAPEHSTHRAQYPAEAVATVRTVAADAGAPFVSTLDAVDDDGFWDPYHFNVIGKAAYRSVLGPRLAEALAQCR